MNGDQEVIEAAIRKQSEETILKMFSVKVKSISDTALLCLARGILHKIRVEGSHEPALCRAEGISRCAIRNTGTVHTEAAKINSFRAPASL